MDKEAAFPKQEPPQFQMKLKKTLETLPSSLHHVPVDAHQLQLEEVVVDLVPVHLEKLVPVVLALAVAVVSEMKTIVISPELLSPMYLSSFILTVVKMPFLVQLSFLSALPDHRLSL